ncbi:MAG: hypothetical protein AAB316_09715 [Bacteroidota bacterium]
MAKNTVPLDVQHAVQQIVEAYNKKARTQYQVVFKTKYCYLSRMDDKRMTNNALSLAARLLGLSSSMINTAPETETKIGRLEWTGDMSKWSFAVFKYSREAYDANEWFFPGSELLDGTIEGAMKAGHKIYP